MQRVVIAISLALTSMPAPAQESASCRQFVQKFLDWYVSLPPKKGEASFDVATDRKPDLFSPELLKALNADAEARKRVSDDIVGLDFDPFLYTQDPSPRYEARGGDVKDRVCLVAIGPASSKKPGNAAVFAELHPEGTSWRFVNFRYPGDKTDLLQILAQLRRERAKEPK